jgi:hypothetical protein
MMKTIFLTFSLCVLTAFAGETNKLTTYIGRFEQPFPGPQSYRDADSGIIFYVESDGRHIAAIGQDGKLLWHRDPFADARLEAMTGKGSGKFVCISYNSSQAGVLDMKTGDFTFMGQD